MVAVVVAYLAAPPPATIKDCFAANGFAGVVVYADGSIDVPQFTWADNNARQAWDAHTDTIYDRCVR